MDDIQLQQGNSLFFCYCRFVVEEGYRLKVRCELVRFEPSKEENRPIETKVRSLKEFAEWVEDPTNEWHVVLQ